MCWPVESGRLSFWIGQASSLRTESKERMDLYPRCQGQCHFPESRTLTLRRKNDRDPAPYSGNSSVSSTLCKLKKVTHKIIRGFPPDLEEIRVVYNSQSALGDIHNPGSRLRLVNVLKRQAQLQPGKLLLEKIDIDLDSVSVPITHCQM